MSIVRSEDRRWRDCDVWAAFLGIERWKASSRRPEIVSTSSLRSLFTRSLLVFLPRTFIYLKSSIVNFDVNSLSRCSILSSRLEFVRRIDVLVTFGRCVFIYLFIYLDYGVLPELAMLLFPLYFFGSVASSSPRLCFSRLLRRCWIWSDFCTEKTEVSTPPPPHSCLSWVN